MKEGTDRSRKNDLMSALHDRKLMIEWDGLVGHVFQHLSLEKIFGPSAFFSTGFVSRSWRCVSGLGMVVFWMYGSMLLGRKVSIRVLEFSIFLELGIGLCESGIGNGQLRGFQLTLLAGTGRRRLIWRRKNWPRGRRGRLGRGRWE